jgi:hypothetical protein
MEISLRVINVDDELCGSVALLCDANATRDCGEVSGVKCFRWELLRFAPILA